MSAVAPLPFRPGAVLFDMDGLMLDSERAINACMAQAARELGHDVPDTLWLQMIGGGDGLCRRLLAEQVGDAAGVALLAHAERLYDAVADAGIEHRPGVVPLLDWLVARDVPRAVATSTRSPLAMRKLAAARLLPAQRTATGPRERSTSFPAVPMRASIVIVRGTSAGALTE